MVGLVPTIHVFASLIECGVQDVDARHKGEHDGSWRLLPNGPRPATCPANHLDPTSSAMTDILPDRLSSNPNSPFYNEELLARDIGVRFKGVEKTNVEEYCVSEGWVRLTAGNAKDRHGNPMTVKLKGPVEPYFRNAE
jgi:hypothetical protein